MRTNSFSEAALCAAYEMAAERNGNNFEQFAEQSKFFEFAVSSLGAGLSLDVECDTSLPVSTPAEKREKLFQDRLLRSQEKANQVLNRQRKIQERAAKIQERLMKKAQRTK